MIDGVTDVMRLNTQTGPYKLSMEWYSPAIQIPRRLRLVYAQVRRLMLGVVDEVGLLLGFLRDLEEGVGTDGLGAYF